MKSKMGCLVPFISIFYVIGFAILAHSLASAVRSTRPAKWPTASGTITHLEMVKNSDDDGTSYRVKVEYAYAVEGVTYQGDRLAFGYGSSSGRETHQEILDKLRSAKSVDVRYDSADPSTSCLSYGLHRSIQMSFAFSVTWLAFCIGFTMIWRLLSRSDAVMLDNLSVQ